MTFKKVLTLSSCVSVLLAVPLLGSVVSVRSAIASTPSTASGSMNKTAKSAPSTMSMPKSSVKSATVSVNKGTDADLQKVKGIGPVTAKKIISNRPYKSLEDLVTKKALSPAQLKALKSSLSL